MPTHPAYKVIPVWRKDLLKMVRMGHKTRVVCSTLKVGYDRLLDEKRRDAEFAQELEAAEAEGATKGARRFMF